MTEQPSVKLPDLKDLFFKEYEYLSALFVANEESGEKRVGLFITLTTALGAAIVVARDKVQDMGQQQFLALVLTVATAWLLVGVSTLKRIIRRNLATQDCLRGLRRIRQHLIAATDARAWQVLPFDPYGPLPVKERKGYGLGNGGFAEMIALMNSLIAGAAMGVGSVFVLGAPVQMLTLATAVVAAAFAWVVQISYIRVRYEQDTARARSEEELRHGTTPPPWRQPPV
jgi:hypothetical protein